MNRFGRVLFLNTVFFLLYLPIIVLIIYSFNDARFSMQWHGATLHWYQQLTQDHDLWSAFFHSVFLGASASIIATITATLACIHLFLSQSHKQKQMFHLGLLFLIIIPDLVLGIALLIFFNMTNIPLGFGSLLIAHITFCLPFVALTVNSRLYTLDVNIYFSALDLGANRYTALTKVLLPLLFPAIFSACLLCFTLSFDDVIISYFVAGPEFNILPLTIYSLVRNGVTPELNALCSATFLISMILVFIAHRLSRKTI